MDSFRNVSVSDAVVDAGAAGVSVARNGLTSAAGAASAPVGTRARDANSVKTVAVIAVRLDLERGSCI